MGVCGCGTGNDPQADGMSNDYFQLTPDAETVTITVPPAQETTNLYNERKRIVVSCQGRQDQTFNFDGHGAFISLSFFGHNGVDQITKSHIQFALQAEKGWRERGAVDVANFIQTNANDTVVVCVDLNGGGLLGSNQGGRTVRENVIDVFRLAQDNNVPIWEVYCAGNRTHNTLIAAMTQTADNQNYANVRVFEKPGTGGACDDACLEQNVVGNVRFNQQITNFTNAVVMGFDGSICVGKTIFGGWRTDTQQGQVINEVQQQTVREYYERGLLDLGLNVITSRLVNICGNVGGAMVNGYLKFND